MIDCFEVSEKGIQRVSVPLDVFYERIPLPHGGASMRRYWNSLSGARVAFEQLRRWPQNPRVAPRTGVGVVVTHRAAAVLVVPRIDVHEWLFPSMCEPYGIDKTLYVAQKNERGTA